MTDKTEPGTEIATAESPSASIIQVIERAALNPDVDIEKMERLLAMHERILDRNAEQEFNMAMVAAQTGMRPVSADATNPQTRSKYASYTALDQALRPVYTREGFCLSFDGGDGAPDNYVRVLCYVGHTGGHTRTYHTDMPADGKGAKGGDVMTKTHAAGAAFTYGQRYLLKLIFNVAIGEYDDDGNSAGGVIDANQKEHIVRMLKETEADIPKFLKYMKVESVDEIPAARFPVAIEALNAKKMEQHEKS